MTLEEMYDLINDRQNETYAAIVERVDSAIVSAAFDLIEAGGTTVEQRAWIKNVLYNPSPETDKAWRYIVAANSEATLAQAIAVTDEQIITAVNAVAPILIAAMSKV